MTVSSTHLHLALVTFHLLAGSSTSQNLCIECHKSSLAEGECVPGNQTLAAESYADCCVLPEGSNVSTHSFRLDHYQRCTTPCGPVLDEAQFFPVMPVLDSSIVFIQWALHPLSLPATSYTLSVGLESEGTAGLTTVSISSEALATRHQFTPVTAGLVYTISLTAVNEPVGVASLPVRARWRAGEDIYPTFTNFSASLLSPTGSVLASWAVLTPGLRPLIHLTVRWVELSSVGEEDDLADPTSLAYPRANIAVMEYDIKTQVVIQHDIISLTLGRGLTVNETYVVAVSGTSVLGSKTTLFTFTAEMNNTLLEVVPSAGKQIYPLPPVVLTLLLSLVPLIHRQH